LYQDGNGQRAAANAAFMAALFRIAIHQATAQRTQIFFMEFFGDFSRLDGHSTPPQNFPRVRQEI
jgi:hypothetical protein